MGRFSTDLLRVLAGTFIIFNHTSWNLFVMTGRSNSIWPHIISFFNQLGKPAVLFFIFLSGFAFARHRLNLTPGYFYLNRIFRILPPYILVSFLGVLVTAKEHNNYFTMLLGGYALFHLYFIPLILLCYLLFPLLKKIPFNIYTALLMTAVITGGYLYTSAANGNRIIFNLQMPEISEHLIKDSYYRSQFYRWVEYISFAIPVFTAGIWAGQIKRRDERSRHRRSYKTRFTVIIAVAAAFALVLTDYYIRVSAGVHPDTAGRIWRLSVLIYAAATVAMFTVLFHRDSFYLLRQAARASFLVYLIHPFFILMTRHIDVRWQILTVIPLSWAAALFLQWLALRFKSAGFFLGEGDRFIRYPS